MTEDISNKLIIAISSRALFDLDESNAVFESEGIEGYARYQIARENNILNPGVALSLVQKLLNLNHTGHWVEVILLSRNSADTGLRIFNSIAHYDLKITRAAFTSGNSPYRYIQAFGSHLFLSAHPQDVRDALNAGCAAATIISNKATLLDKEHTHMLNIAFDGDAVLFSDEAEQIYQTGGLDAFVIHEQKDANKPLPGGPFKGFLSALQHLQSKFSAKDAPIRTALVTARQAPAHERVIKTLRSWNIRIDEALFLGGLEKERFLHAFQADIFFDDQQIHCQNRSTYITTAHVPHGCNNEISNIKINNE